MKLSPNEKKTLRGLAEGLLGPEIAARNGWRYNYPHTYAHRAKRKLRCRTRTQTVVKFILMEREGKC